LNSFFAIKDLVRDIGAFLGLLIAFAALIRNRPRCWLEPADSQIAGGFDLVVYNPASHPVHLVRVVVLPRNAFIISANMDIDHTVRTAAYDRFNVLVPAGGQARFSIDPKAKPEISSWLFVAMTWRRLGGLPCRAFHFSYGRVPRTCSYFAGRVDSMRSPDGAPA
jgi:hypothetical protein